MITKVIKRDGRKVNFNVERIAKSIYKAANSLGGQDYSRSEELANKVYEKLDKIQENKQVTSQMIQDVVKEVLKDEGHTSTLKVYTSFREERDKVRERNLDIIKTYKKLTFEDSKDSNVKRENANINADTAMGTMLKYGSEGAKNFYQLCVLKPIHGNAHKEGDIHIHDLDFLTLTTTCCQIDLIKLYKDGFCTGEGFLREPQSIASYAALAAIAIQSNQNDQHGGQSIPNFEYAMAKGVRVTYKKEYLKNLIKAIELLTDVEDPERIANDIVKSIKYDKDIVACYEDSNGYLKVERKYLSKYFDKDTIEKIQKFTVKYTDKEVTKATYQAMEGFIHNLNTMHSRAGAQVPFSSINYGLDTTPEGRLVMKQLLYATEAGLGNGETPIFPIQIFRVKEGINYNPEDPNYDIFKLSCKVSAKRLFPNFSFIDAPFNLQYYRKGDYNTEVAYMGCRTRVMGNVYDKSREVTCGRGNLSFTSINLPRIGIEANGDIEKFFEMLDEKVDLVIDQLKSRFQIQANKRVYNYPFLMGQNVWLDSEKLGNSDKVGEVLKHGSLTVGFIGLAECLKALIGKHHGESEEARELGIKIISHMRERIDDQAQKDKLNFTLIATPAEGLSGRFVRMDKKRYGVIEGVTDREYYTNSFHVPVYYKTSAFNKIKIEAPYHELTNGGHISYVELDGDPTKNLEAFEQIIRCMKESGIGYGSINHPVDRDPICGFTGIIKDICPCCGRKEFEEAENIKERITRIRR
ncbi:MAG: anaerobic ribonucleoside triphosphate reductase [Clostridia bacterium]|nr:anaerobic ribonucleoside triphosphate reductase [Clostridia bacterium]